MKYFITNFACAVGITNYFGWISPLTLKFVDWLSLPRFAEVIVRDE